VHNKPIEKKIEQELGMIFKIVLQLFENIKMVFYDNRKKIYVSPPPPVDEVFDGLSGKFFKVILKKISCKGTLQKKKFLQAIGG
jgi:hypothetical protein